MAKPAQKSHSRIKVNLLHPQGIPDKLPTRFLKWALTYGRFIVVVVEIVVVASFLLRFKYDADINDLKNKINQQAPYIEAKAQEEVAIKQTQSRLTLIKESYDTSFLWKQTLDKLNATLPRGVTLNNLQLEQPEEGAKTSIQLKITGSANSIADLAYLLNSLKNDPSFSNINLSSISFDQGLIIFSITGASK